MKINKKEAVILKKNKDINTRTFTFGGKNAGKDSPPEPYVLRKQYTKLGRLIINRIGTMSGFTPEITYQLVITSTSLRSSSQLCTVGRV